MVATKGAVAERSELECFVLGLVWQRGPCSPYELRRHMASSPSRQWSASAGAIYPLMRRLEAEGLLSSAMARHGRRARREYRMTPAGLTVLRRWLGPPLTEAAITVSHDPLRSRARFLGALSAARQREWIAAALASLDVLAERVQAWQEQFGAGGDPFLELLTRSGELDVAARRGWLKRLRQELAAAGKGRREKA
jgi:DNA-binding PadR family transcriptional regulator